MIQITLPIKTLSEANLREHWAAKSKRVKLQRTYASVMVGQHFRKIMATGRFIVTLTRIAPRSLDSDNLPRSFKAIRDGVADAIGIDDGSKRYTWVYDQKKGKPKEYAVKIKIEED